MSRNITVLKNGLVFTQNDHFERLDIVLEYGDIRSVSKNVLIENAQYSDCSECYIIPGLADVHFHGCAGYDFCRADVSSLEIICRYEFSMGVTALCPTTMTLPLSDIENIIKTVVDYTNKASNTDIAKIVGIHLEGPFIAPDRCGAQKKEYAELPCSEWLKKISFLSGDLLKLVTIAPELDGAISCIKECRDIMHFSLGHTNCTYSEAASAFNAGADHVTHLFNAMPLFHHRDTGLIGAASDDPNCFAELICDGVHVDPTAVRTAFRLFGDDRIIMISDSMEAAGMPDGEYSLGGNKVYKNGNRAVLKDGTLAGSVSTLYECFKTAVSIGVPLESAVKAASVNPRRSIGLECSIKEGNKAELLILDQNDLSIKRVIRY